MIPVEADLVIVDWSGIVHGAWHERGPEGMLARAAGELLDLLAPPKGDEGFLPARLVLATDAGLPTHRHELTAGLDAPRRYKANRERKPREFWPLVDRLEQLPLALRVPTLAPAGFAPQTWEADDSAAAAVLRARVAGCSVLLVTRDKDWRQLITDEAPAVRWWSATDQKLLDRAGVIEAHGVPPEMLADWLALVGDASDNVPGVEGVGPEKAAALLKSWGSLAAILGEVTPAATAIADMTKGVEKLRRERDKILKGFGDATEIVAKAATAAGVRDRWAWLARVHAQRAGAELSRKLVELRADVPIELDLDEALVGGWDVREVQDVLRSLGCGWLGKGLEARPKRAPRRRRDDGAPAPRRNDGAMEGARPEPGGFRGRPGIAMLAPETSPGGAGEPDLALARDVDAGAAQGAPAARTEGSSGVLRPLGQPVETGGGGGVPPLSSAERGRDEGAGRLPDPQRHPVLTSPDDDLAGVEERLARALVKRTHTALGRKYAIEDLAPPGGGRKVKFPRLPAAVREELLAELRRHEVAA